MPPSAFVPLALFMALLAAAALVALAVSGHFPLADRTPAWRSPSATAILLATTALAAASLAAGAVAAWRQVPWTALVIGGGMAVLAAPLLLRALPDWFVDGRGAPLTFAGAAGMLALVLLWW